MSSSIPPITLPPPLPPSAKKPIRLNGKFVFSANLSKAAEGEDLAIWKDWRSTNRYTGRREIRNAKILVEKKKEEKEGNWPNQLGRRCEMIEGVATGSNPHSPSLLLPIHPSIHVPTRIVPFPVAFISPHFLHHSRPFAISPSKSRQEAKGFDDVKDKEREGIVPIPNNS
jgi:hypothetical protein